MPGSVRGAAGNSRPYRDHGAAAAASPDQGGEARLDLSEGSARRHDARVTGLAMGSAVEPSAGRWPESPRTARQTSA
jgi:hypothetical protein